jgi:hypothetical protein
VAVFARLTCFGVPSATTPPPSPSGPSSITGSAPPITHGWCSGTALLAQGVCDTLRGRDEPCDRHPCSSTSQRGAPL